MLKTKNAFSKDHVGKKSGSNMTWRFIFSANIFERGWRCLEVYFFVGVQVLCGNRPFQLSPLSGKHHNLLELNESFCLLVCCFYLSFIGRGWQYSGIIFL